MNFVLQTPSLQHVAGIKIVSHLWSQRDVFSQILRACNSEPDYDLNVEAEEWIEIEEKVESKVSALPLPDKCIKTQLISLIKPLGTEFITWLHYHNEESNGYNFLALLLPQQLRWTMHGAVDYKKTAQLMVKDERVDIERRYEIACINCLEDDARELFKSVPIKRKREYINDEVEYWCREHRNLTLYFTWTLCGHVSVLKREFQALLLPGDSIHKYLFKEMLFTSDRAMCQYFFEKLNREEKEQVFEETETKMFSYRLPPPGSLIYFLSLMSEEQIERVFRECNFGVLSRLLDWPEQFLFVEMAKRGWPFMSERDCAMVFRAIALKISRGYLHFDYAQLFWECWGLTSAEHKRFYLEDARYSETLVFTKREEFIKLILNEGSLLFHEDLFVYDERYRELFMNESAISFAALRECKERAELNSSNEDQDAKKRRRSEDLIQFLDVVMKRRRLLREEVEAKRLRNHYLLGRLLERMPTRRLLRDEEESDDEDSDGFCEWGCIEAA